LKGSDSIFYSSYVSTTLNALYWLKRASEPPVITLYMKPIEIGFDAFLHGEYEEEFIYDNV